MRFRDDPDVQLVTAYVPADDARRIIEVANAAGMSRAELLRRMISATIEQHDKESV